MVELGMRPADASGPNVGRGRTPRRRDRLGTLAPGMIADVVAVPAIRSDITGPRKVFFVMKEGSRLTATTAHRVSERWAFPSPGRSDRHVQEVSRGRGGRAEGLFCSAGCG